MTLMRLFLSIGWAGNLRGRQSLVHWGLDLSWLRRFQTLEDRVVFQAELSRHDRSLYSIFLISSLAKAR
jgi:hypothetical protein